MVQGVERTFNEVSVTDARALCFYASSGLFTGGADLRDALLADLCDADPGATFSGQLSFASHAGGDRVTLDVEYTISVTAEVTPDGHIELKTVTGSASETYTYASDAEFLCGGGFTATGRPDETRTGTVIGGSGLGLADGDPIGQPVIAPLVAGIKVTANCSEDGTWTATSSDFEASFDGIRGVAIIAGGITTALDFNRDFTDEFGTEYVTQGRLDRAP